MRQLARLRAFVYTWLFLLRVPGEVHLCFPSDAYPSSRHCCSLVARALKPVGNEIQTSSGLFEEWSEMVRLRRSEGVASKPFEFVARYLVHFHVGGAGGPRFLSMCSCAGPWDVWSELTALPLAQCGMS